MEKRESFMEKRGAYTQDQIITSELVSSFSSIFPHSFFLFICDHAFINYRPVIFPLSGFCKNLLTFSQ